MKLKFGIRIANQVHSVRLARLQPKLAISNNQSLAPLFVYVNASIFVTLSLSSKVKVGIAGFHQ